MPQGYEHRLKVCSSRSKCDLHGRRRRDAVDCPDGLPRVCRSHQKGRNARRRDGRRCASRRYWDDDDGPAPSGHYLAGVTVLPAWRRRGVGAALTEARLRWVWARASEAWYVVNADNLVSIELHRRWNFTEMARGPRFHTTTFTGGLSLLMCAAAPGTPSPQTTRGGRIRS
ncbi:GNAT family N-acetyltransferase [Pseudarthrobacter sp. MDT3-26]|uniref:GNAT family N-acetyltransferase n=1 Tax=Pseudarthrobacter raffinosi TaxID=2953651 RepID=UPI00208FABBD|nr:GNAT family N-acetyltransferase [Pseudarthrobacter sp. MDT3-26]MCO4262536.1 GNAT family N-acetyltransferase [Pseudarthrobacter sp. MDT3-26]